MVQAQKWGADRNTLLLLYRQLIRSKLDYGCMVYGSAKEKDLKRLDPVHHSGIRIALGAFKTSPVKSLLVEANEPPLDLRRDLLLIRYSYRVQQYKENLVTKLILDPKILLYENKPNLHKSIGKKFADLKTQYQLEDLPEIAGLVLSSKPPWVSKRPSIQRTGRQKKAEAQHEIYRQQHNRHRHDHSDAAFIYTDAAKDQHGTGCAFIHEQHVRRFTLPNWISIGSAELEAIYQAIIYADLKKIRKVVIYSDALGPLMSLDKLFSQNPYVIKIRDTIFDVGLQPLFCWLPSHIGITGNEKVDGEAKKAILNGLFVNGHILSKDLNKFIKKAIKDIWQSTWNNCTENKLRAIKHRIGSWKSADRQNRREETALCRLRLGHTRLTHSYLFTRDKEPPKCRLCNETVTVKHILTDCHRLQDLRDKHNLPETLTEILADNENSIRQLFSYLQDADLLEEI